MEGATEGIRGQELLPYKQLLRDSKCVWVPMLVTLCVCVCVCVSCLMLLLV